MSLTGTQYVVFASSKMGINDGYPLRRLKMNDEDGDNDDTDGVNDETMTSIN